MKNIIIKFVVIGLWLFLLSSFLFDRKVSDFFMNLYSQPLIGKLHFFIYSVITSGGLIILWMIFLQKDFGFLKLGFFVVLIFLSINISVFFVSSTLLWILLQLSLSFFAYYTSKY